MKVLRAAVVLGVSTPLVVLACGSDDPAITSRGAAGEGGESAGGASSGGNNKGGSSSGTAGTSAAGGELTNGGATPGEGGGGGAGAPEVGGAGGQTSAGAGGEGGTVTEPEPECGDASVNGGLVCYSEPAPHTLVEGTPADVAIGEWNGAAGLDIIITSNLGVSFLPNDGAGTFTTDTYVTSTQAGAVLGVGQLDTASNHLDLLDGQPNTGYSQIVFGDGEGQLAQQEFSYFNSEGVTFNYFVADVPGSPLSDDIVVTFNNSISVVPTTGNEGEGFTVAQPATTYPTTPLDAVLAQLGSAQWLVYSTQGNLGRQQVTFDSGSITLSAAPDPTPAGGTPGQLDVGDFDEDGFDDIVATLGGSGDVSVFFGDGTGTGGFAIVSGDDHFLTLAIGTSDEAKTQRDVKVGDFNGDGHADLAVSVQGLDAIAVFSGDGQGGFTGPDLVSTGADSGPTRLAVGDLNADGVDDLVAVGAGSSKVIVVQSDP